LLRLVDALGLTEDVEVKVMDSEPVVEWLGVTDVLGDSEKVVDGELVAEGEVVSEGL
jgi:hypothetical protein